jgi:hypothetical protein
MLDVNVAEECPPEVALGIRRRLVVVAQHSSDMREPVVVREKVPCNRGACSGSVAAWRDLVEGGVAGKALRENQRQLGHQHRSRHCLLVREHSSKPAIYLLANV